MSEDFFKQLQDEAKKNYKKDPNKNRTGKNSNMGRKKSKKNLS